MRTADETLHLFRQVMNQRREYVRGKLKAIEMKGREQQPRYEQALRGGMLSELSTIECVLDEIEKGKSDPLTWWAEPIPKE